jgi:cobalt-zinc-cadmium efflux system protein
MSWVDPALSLLIAAMILWSSVGILRETLNILLEGTPKNMQLGAVRKAMETVPGVLDVHDLHVWSLGAQSHALSSHVRISEMPASECSSILNDINSRLHDRFHITHTTIQFETSGCETTHGCSSPPEPEAVGAQGHVHSH